MAMSAVASGQHARVRWWRRPTAYREHSSNVDVVVADGHVRHHLQLRAGGVERTPDRPSVVSNVSNGVGVRRCVRTTR